MRRSINTRCLMRDAILKHEGLKLFGHIFFGIITSQILNRNKKLSVNFSTKGTEVRNNFERFFIKYNQVVRE